MDACSNSSSLRTVWLTKSLATGGMDPDFFWLGRVPCRSVLVYGVIVGVQQYEQRTVYYCKFIRQILRCEYANQHLI